MAASPTAAVSVLIVLALAAVSSAAYDGVIRMYPRVHLVRPEGYPKCESWKFAVEVNAAGSWKAVPRPCVEFVREYFNTDRYLLDSRAVANFSLGFANSVNVADGNGKDAWVFDVDETLLSNLPYYTLHGYGSVPYNDTSFNEWVNTGLAPALPMSLKLFNKLKSSGFKIFLLTGRPESQRAITLKNLVQAGYSGWERLILRQTADEGKKATAYKSEKRAELEAEGYVIQGSSGDQWSDLMGYALSKRSFKLPNPLYYIP